MQSSSLLCASNCLSPSASLSTSPRFPFPLSPNRCCGLVVDSSCIARVKLESLQFQRSVLTPVNGAATQEILETSTEEPEFVEIGQVCSVHGLQGEVRIKPNTDFPELRFSEPGKRWLRQQILGREIVREIELLEGRGHPGRKGWIVKFNEIDTPDQAQSLIGSTLLVTEEDKPELEEDEFYSKDLVGMKVILKDTGEPVGTVVNVFNSGASDLLQVMLIPSTPGGLEDPSASGPLVWIPFVEAIVPTVDMGRREMLITPPKGLLELNIRSDERSKKERRQLEWKEKKKFQQRLIAAKKKLCELEQQHVFHGFRFGEKSQGSLLANQIIGVNSKLLQQALQYIQIPSNRWDLREYVEANLAKDVKSRLRIPGKYISNSGNRETQNESSKLQDKGCLLTSEGKVAMVLFVDDCKIEGNIFASDPVDHAEVSCLLDSFFNDNGRYPQMEDRASVPLILVCPAHAIDSVQDTFATCNHFSFDKTKVWFLEEEKLPVVSNCLEEQSKHKILMKSPWEMLQTPIGSGGITSLLSSNSILENLSNAGVEYIEVSSMNVKYIGGYTLLGLAHSRGADIGIQILDIDDLEDTFDMVFSMKYMNYLIKNTDQLHFDAIPKKHPHVDKVDKEWVDIAPSSPNSYELNCSVYSYLKPCSPDKVCLMEVIE